MIGLPEGKTLGPGWSAGQKTSLRVVAERKLLGNRQRRVSGYRVHLLVIGDALQIQVLAGAAQRALLAHHGGDPVSLLTESTLFVSRSLPVFETGQLLRQLFTNPLIQTVSRYC